MLRDLVICRLDPLGTHVKFLIGRPRVEISVIKEIQYWNHELENMIIWKWELKWLTFLLFKAEWFFFKYEHGFLCSSFTGNSSGRFSFLKVWPTFWFFSDSSKLGNSSSRRFSEFFYDAGISPAYWCKLSWTWSFVIMCFVYCIW